MKVRSLRGGERIRSKEDCSRLLRGFPVVYLLERKEESPRKEEGILLSLPKKKAVGKNPRGSEEYLIYIRVSFPPEVRRLLL